MHIIENDLLRVAVSTTGAELQSIFHKQNNLEYLWSGDPAFWAKKSPVLFPVVGALKENRYFFDGKSYSLNRHGFARESEFEVLEQSGSGIGLILKSNPHTLENFPFHFEFTIRYLLKDDGLNVSYEIRNKGLREMYFSVGGHPAFKVPLEEGTTYQDYYLEFDKRENAGRWPISKDGLIEAAPVPCLVDTTRLPLTKDLFSNDALVFKHLSSSSVSLKCDKTSHGLTLHFGGFPYLGIWAAKNADFVCIEPWCGIADNVNTSQQLIEKEGINKLPHDQTFSKTWSLTVF